MNVDVVEAGRRLGDLCAQAKEQPVIVEVSGRPSAVLLAYEDYQRLTGTRLNPVSVNQFTQAHSAWFAEHNRLVDEVGVFGESLRPW
jgi:prevent-host-death family protein